LHLPFITIDTGENLLKLPTSAAGRLPIFVTGARNRIGLGCMALTGIYGPIAREDALAVIRHAFDLGVDHYDTAELYGPYINEELLADALGPRSSEVRIATKVGYRLEGGRIAGHDSSREAIRRSVEGSLRRLRRASIDLLYQHRPDPHIPVEDVVGTMAELVKEGKVAELGLCATDNATLQRAREIHPIAAVQNGYSLIEREAEAEVLPALSDRRTAFVAYSPLARGILAGVAIQPARRSKTDYRRSDSRFSVAGLASLRCALSPLWEMADRHNVPPAAIAIAWVLSKGPVVHVIPGARSLDQLTVALRAAEISLSGDDRLKLDEIAATVGSGPSVSS
jgi:aryl-alcohol dehydrogenase-like predicted oxidoreductase